VSIIIIHITTKVKHLICYLDKPKLKEKTILLLFNYFTVIVGFSLMGIIHTQK